MTDVNIAIELVRQAYLDRYDVAYLVTADSDLEPAVKMVKELFPDKELVSVNTYGYLILSSSMLQRRFRHTLPQRNMCF